MNERRARRKPGENRARLLEAGLIEFGLFGYHGASTSSIAARADVPQPHVYANFGSKKDLFVACLNCIIDDASLFASAAIVQTHHDASLSDRRHVQHALFLFQAIAAANTVELRDSVPQTIHKLVSTYGDDKLAQVLVVGARVLVKTAS